jgi:hypothetical protein
MRPHREHHSYEDCGSYKHYHHDRDDRDEYRHEPECHPLVDVVRKVCGILETGPRIGLGLLGCLEDFRPLLLSSCLPRLSLRRTQGCGCEIPPPCWAPKPLGCICSQVCPGGTATLRFRITNCGTTKRDFTIEGAPTVTPATLSLDPQARGFSVVSATVPPDASFGHEYEYLVWVRGCRDHFLRWTVVVSHHMNCECEEVHVEDCPELIHHWYDHYYCARPCNH